MPTRDQLDAMDLYGAIMGEVKFRIEAVNHTLLGGTGLLSPFANEFCFLQLRMLCELIALSCLVAHGDIKETKSLKFKKAWQADDIIKMLENLHPDFYPIPIADAGKKDGVRAFDQRRDPYLTKEDILTLYAKCGQVLHRGTLKKLISKTPPVQVHFPDILAWLQKISALLSAHRILLFSGGEMILCQLSSSRTQNVNVAFAEVKERRRSPSGEAQG